MASGLKVTVTGPTGDIGLATLRALDASPAVAEIVGMARRPFDPAAHGLSKVSYRQGDVLDRAAVDGAVDGADVVVHLAFIIFGDPDEAQPINIEGSRNVFEATVAAGADRLVYTSSVAAYGFHDGQSAAADRGRRRRVAPRASTTRPTRPSSSGCSARCWPGLGTDAYVFRPSIVGGPDAHTLVETIVGLLPVYGQLPLVRQFFSEVPFLAPVLPDPGVPDPARPSRRRRHGAAGRDRGQGRAGRLQPRGAGER